MRYLQYFLLYWWYCFWCLWGYYQLFRRWCSNQSWRFEPFSLYKKDLTLHDIQSISFSSQILVDQQDFVLVTNPVVNQMIKLKAKVFGTKYLRLNVFLYLLFTLLWTASISIRETNQFGWTYKVSMIVVLTIFGELISFHFMWKVRSLLFPWKDILRVLTPGEELIRSEIWL